MSKTSITDKITKLNQDVEWFYGDDFALDLASEKYKAAPAAIRNGTNRNLFCC